MTSIIEKIYYGDLRPCEESAPPTERYIKNRKDICAVEDQLLKRCTDCEELIEKYKDALRAESQYESEADFARGFKIGAMIMFEILVKDSI